jgi:hypothetical protein
MRTILESGNVLGRFLDNFRGPSQHLVQTKEVNKTIE